MSGKAELPSELSLGKNYKITIGGSITSQTDSDNQDGTLTRYYKFEPILVELIDEKGERIHARDVRSRSQQLRSLIWKNWRDNGENIEFDKYYDEVMLEIINSQYELKQR